MGISIEAGSIIIDDTVVGFDDILDTCVFLESSIVSKNKDVFFINGNVILQNNAVLKDISKTIICTGELFQVRSGSTLSLGSKLSDDTATNGCNLILPNIKQLNGFGSIDPNDTNTLLCYGSYIEANCYWGFSSSESKVEIQSSTVVGYGRISGSESILKNVTFKKVSGLYGILIPVNEIKTYSNVNVDTVDRDPDTSRSSLLALDANVTPKLELYFGSLAGYQNLIYADSYSGEVILYGTAVKDSIYNIIRNESELSFYHKFKCRFKIQNVIGDPLQGSTVIIRNRLNEIEHQGQVDSDGYVLAWITYYRDVNQLASGILTPHIVEIHTEDDVYAEEMMITTNLLELPIVVPAKVEVASTSVRADLNEVMDVNTAKIMEKLDAIQSAINMSVGIAGGTFKPTSLVVKSKNAELIL